MIAIVIILSINKSREISPTTFIFVLVLIFYCFNSFYQIFLVCHENLLESFLVCVRQCWIIHLFLEAFFFSLDELVDFKAELERLEKEKAGVLKEISFVSGKLNNANFVAKAPEALVNEQREKLAKYNEKLAMLEESIAKINNK